MADYGDGFSLMHVDRLIVRIFPLARLTALRARGIPLHNPELVFGCADHAVSTDPGSNDPRGLNNPYVVNLREQSKHFGLTMFEPHDIRYGIMHVIAPELGLTLLGLTLDAAATA